MQVPDLMKFTSNEKAVSPVIGVILMVSITVILAAVIAAFVFGMARQISPTKVIGATAQQSDSSHVVITYNGGKDSGLCVGIRWTVSRADGTLLDSAMMGYTGGTVPLAVGEMRTLAATTGKDHVVGSAYFSDGAQQVILDAII